MMNKSIKNIIVKSLCTVLVLSAMIFPCKQPDNGIMVCTPGDKIGGEVM